MRNWYTLPFTLILFFSTYFLRAQESVHVQWSADISRYPVDVQIGKTNINICDLVPGGTYSVIVTQATNGTQPAFEWQIHSILFYQKDEQFPHQVMITPEASCATLELKTFAGSMSGKLPVYLSINRTDDPKPEPEGPGTDQPELANLSTTAGTAAGTLISTVLIGGNCFDVTNVTSAGQGTSRGTFTNGNSNIGIDQGVVLCTGSVGILPGPNNSGSANGGYALVPTPDPDLAALAGGGTLYDLSKIEFDFRPTSPTLSFDFVFGSEEYCEFVDGGFNDVFGFFISGPGIPGTQNIAVIPSTSTPVSIDNVSHVTNSTYFVGNSNTCGFPPTNNAECQLDGWTSVFTAVANVIPCSTYHIKLAIADVSDAAYASAVFLRANSFAAGGVANAVSNYPTTAQYVIEGCNQGYIRIFRGSGDINEDVIVNFTVSGTASPGVDYDPIVGPLIIPAGQQFILVPVNVIPDLITEGNETVILSLSNSCSCTQTQVTFNIHDLEPLLVTLNDVNGCGSSNTVLSPSVSGAQAPLMYHWSNGASSATLNVAAVGTNTYTVTVTDACGRTSSAEATVTLAPIPTAALSGSGVFCVGASGSVNLTLTLTGQPDWTVTYLANGVPTTEVFSSSPATITATSGGAYSLVSVVSDNGCPGTVSGNVNLPTVNVNLNLTPTNPSCFGLTNGAISSSPSGGTAPYTYSWTPSGSGANPTNLAPGTYTVTVTSSQGCTEEATVTLVEPPLLEASTNAPATIDCTSPSVSIDLTVTGGTPNYTYTWTGGSSAQDPNITVGGTYTVTVRDARNCTTTASVTVAANNTLPTAVIAPPASLNCNVQSLTLNGNGSSQGPEFEYNWAGPGIICCNTTLQPDINLGGTYTITVTNTDNGCTKTASVTIASNTTPPAANATAPFNIGCNHPTVTLSGTGSAVGAGITYQWSTSDGNIQSGATNLNPVVNQAGTYTIVVTNNNTGCTAEDSVTITGDTQTPTAVVAPAGPVDCFNPVIQLNGTGSSQGPPGFNYNWTGGSISGGGNTLTPTITAGGTYTLVVQILPIVVRLQPP
ncbi:MAG TPA: choice-of-anchor L domain-containing protein [Saprospiraceae bacterium]|nr:choice-of-anchor L domain-containing protein [Saprospiraceae bacterium]HPI08010.1 choice-of-anchor L domain-containing protein [Saprospiraceae bacterium]